MKSIMAKIAAYIAICLVSMGIHASTIDAQKLDSAGAEIVKTKEVMPSYPLDALLDKREGNVVLSYDIDKEGKPTNIAVVSYKGSKRFIRSSMKALKDTRFAPVTSNEQRVEVVGMQKQFDFALVHENRNFTRGLVALNL